MVSFPEMHRNVYGPVHGLLEPRLTDIRPKITARTDQHVTYFQPAHQTIYYPPLRYRNEPKLDQTIATVPAGCSTTSPDVGTHIAFLLPIPIGEADV